MARHAMAELAYLRFDRKETRSHWRCGVGRLRRVGESRCCSASSPELEGKALLDMPGQTIRAWPHRKCVAGWRPPAASKIGRRYGARELPRLDIPTSFLEFELDAPALSRQRFAEAAENLSRPAGLGLLRDGESESGDLRRGGQELLLALFPPTWMRCDFCLPGWIRNSPRISGSISGARKGIVGLFSASERSQTAAMQAYAQLGDCLGVRRSLVRAGNLLVHSAISRMRKRSCASRVARLLEPAGLATAAPGGFQTPATGVSVGFGATRCTRVK